MHERLPGGGRSSLLVLSVLLLGVLAPVWARAQGGAVPAPADTVVSVGVEGSETVDSELVRRGFGVSVGTRYSLDAIRRGIHRLYDLGFFSDVAVEGDRAPGGVALTLRVVENPRVGALEFSGLKKVGEDDLEKAVGPVPGQMADDRLLARVERSALRVYEEKGYTRAAVHPRYLPGDSRSRRILLVEVVEGAKIRVESVRFSGLGHLDPGVLRGAMKQGTMGFLKGGVYKPGVVAEDMKRIEAEMAKHGFRDGKILGYQAVPGSRDEWVVIEVRVEEGPLYYFGGVTWEGNKALSTMALYGATRIRGGGVFNQEKVQQTVEDAYGVYADQGYIYLNIQPDFVGRDSTVDVVFHVTEGEPSKVHDILIAGNTRTKERVIRRQLVLQPGDLFRRNLLVRSQRELQQLGYFSDIQVNSRPVAGSNDIDLILNVEERQVGTASAGFGFSSSVGLTGFIELGHSNLFGNGQSLNLRMERGQSGTNAELSLTEPWFKGTPTTVGVDLFNTTRKYRSADLDLQNARIGGALRLGRPLPLPYTRLFATYRLENQTVSDAAGLSSRPSVTRSDITGFVFNQETQLTSSLALSLVRNSTNHYLYPTDGSNSRLRVEFSGGALGGDQTFQKYELDLARYLPTVRVGRWRPVFMARGRLGAVGEAFRDDPMVPSGYEIEPSLAGKTWYQVPVGYGQSVRVPVPYHLQRFPPESNALFRLGGTSFNAFRGYEDFEIVPQDNATRRFLVSTFTDTSGAKTYTVNADPIYYPGGKYAMVLTGEWQFPVVDPVHGLLLADFGGTWNRPGEFRWDSLHRSLGVGIRMEVPLLGLIGFDYAYGFDRLDRRTGRFDRAGWEPHIQFGKIF